MTRRKKKYTKHRCNWEPVSEEIRAHHRELWQQQFYTHLRNHWSQLQKRRYDLMLRSSLRRLAEQGYGMSEVSVMLGVSRERVRQMVERFGLHYKFTRLGVGSKPRVWNAARGCFVAVESAKYFRQQRAAYKRKAAAARKAALHEARVTAIDRLRALAAQLGRTPTGPELTDYLEREWQGVALLFVGRSRYHHERLRDDTRPWGQRIYATGRRRWYRLAGLSVREWGSRGHVRPEEAVRR